MSVDGDPRDVSVDGKSLLVKYIDLFMSYGASLTWKLSIMSSLQIPSF